MKTFLTLSKVFFVSFLMALTAYAQEQSSTQGGDFPPPHHGGQMSAEKKAEMEQKLATLKATCETDIATLCADAEGPRVIGCLKQNASSLTVSACQDAIAQIPDRPHH